VEALVLELASPISNDPTGGAEDRHPFLEDDFRHDGSGFVLNRNKPEETGRLVDYGSEIPMTLIARYGLH
jgi:hypothetical protein